MLFTLTYGQLFIKKLMSVILMDPLKDIREYIFDVYFAVLDSF